MRNDAAKKLPREGFKRPWPPLIKMDKAEMATVAALFKAWLHFSLAKESEGHKL
jgi:hypothetical protein